MGILSEIFSWWGGNTWSNRIYTGLRGKLVGHRRRRQPLLCPEQGRWTAGRAAPLGHLREPRRGLASAARMARLDALLGGHASDRGDVCGAALAEAAPHEHDRHAAGLSPARAAFWGSGDGRRRPETTSPGGRAKEPGRRSAARHAGATLCRPFSPYDDSDRTAKGKRRIRHGARLAPALQGWLAGARRRAALACSRSQRLPPPSASRIRWPSLPRSTR